MRSTCGSAKWLQNDKQELVGLSLGSDATTDHEQGTRIIAASFGYSYSAKAGVAARQITKLPDSFGFDEITYDGELCLLLASNISRAKGYVGTELRFVRGVKNFAEYTGAAWDDKNFAILSRGPDMAHLRQLAEAFERKDVMAGGLLKASYRIRGLAYAVASRVPQELIDATQQELDEEVTRHGILERSEIRETLRNAGREWLSLDTTIWADESKTSIRVWLNPREQRRYSCGWFTLDELLQWATEKGPVMSKAA